MMVSGFTYLMWNRQALSYVAQNSIASLVVLSTFTLAAWVTLQSSWQLIPPELQRAWRLLGVALTLWVLSQTLDVGSWVILQRSASLPSARDFLKFSGYLAVLAAILTYPASLPERFGRLREFLDKLILGVAVLALTWLVLLRPVLEVGLAGAVRIFWLGIGPVFNLVILVLLLRLGLLSHDAQEAAIFWVFAAAILFFTVGDLSYGFRLMQFEQGSGGLVEIGWVLGGMLLAVSSLRRLAVPYFQRELFHTQRPSTFKSRLETWLPLIFTSIVVGFAGFSSLFSGNADWHAIVASIVLGLLLITRQGVIAGQFEMRQYAALVNASADLAFICEADGLLRLANPSLSISLGQTIRPEETLYLREFLFDRMETKQILSTALEDGWTGEVEFRRKDGSAFPATLSLRPVRDAGLGRTLLAATAYDLTNVRERENALRDALEDVAAARQELETLNIELEAKVEARTSELETMVADLARLNEELKELDRLKTEFVALVSHELRAPLTNIRTGIELILDRSPALKKNVAESLALVHADTRRLSRFVETILNLSALEAGRFQLELVPLPLDTIAQSVCSRFLEKAQLERLKLSSNEVLPNVIADEQALASVYFHILDNALKYASEGEVMLEAWEQGSEVYVAVDDDGPGIPAEERERIFEMFHRLDASDSREVYGYGLGLPMVRRLLEAMGGGIKVEGSRRGGARFIFWLPRAGESHIE